MNKKGFTTESGGRQNGFSIEPEITVISDGESKKSLIVFVVIFISFLIGLFYYFKWFQLLNNLLKFILGSLITVLKVHPILINVKASNIGRW